MKILDQIKKLDKKSEEFFEVYKAIAEKYWDFDEPDDYQKAAKLLNMIAERGDEDQVVVCVKLFEALFKVVEKGGAMTGEFVIGEKPFHFRIFDNPESLDKLTKSIRNTVMVKHSEESK